MTSQVASSWMSCSRCQTCRRLLELCSTLRLLPAVDEAIAIIWKLYHTQRIWPQPNWIQSRNANPWGEHKSIKLELSRSWLDPLAPQDQRASDICPCPAKNSQNSTLRFWGARELKQRSLTRSISTPPRFPLEQLHDHHFADPKPKRFAQIFGDIYVHMFHTHIYILYAPISDMYHVRWYIYSTYLFHFLQSDTIR